MTGTFRQYIAGYSAKAEPLQRRKTALLKDTPRQSFSRRTEREFANSPWSVHFDRTKQLYADLGASKESGHGAISEARLRPRQSRFTAGANGGSTHYVPEQDATLTAKKAKANQPTTDMVCTQEEAPRYMKDSAHWLATTARQDSLVPTRPDWTEEYSPTPLTSTARPSRSTEAWTYAKRNHRSHTAQAIVRY
ncbi:hypothetical protein PENDEC_c003G06619 [Penicillium decumbens]|uniref:Uncharacterized protein n=1 Tax=Penicillium decumbens TaxID=69771 RepID=A0A1V6PJN7_PENDC|nr:hypothetical protein PENDEC_c003G06619 [Penicillium decumbens]